MNSSFDFDKYKKHNPRDLIDIYSDEFDYEFADEFAYDDFADDDDVY